MPKSNNNAKNIEESDRKPNETDRKRKRRKLGNKGKLRTVLSPNRPTPKPEMQNPHQTTSHCPSSSSFQFSTATFKDPKTTLSIVLATSLCSLIFFLTFSSSPLTSSPSLPPTPRPDPFLFPTRQAHTQIDFDDNNNNNNPSDPPPPPSIGYLISGSSGDSGRIVRLLSATYHPRNHYLLHLDRFASQAERDRLAINVQSVHIFKAAQNVDVIGKADFVYPKGSSSLSFTLHGASMLLRLASNWDWFISLNAADYPLVTQDGTAVVQF